MNKLVSAAAAMAALAGLTAQAPALAQEQRAQPAGNGPLTKTGTVAVSAAEAGTEPAPAS